MCRSAGYCGAAGGPWVFVFFHIVHQSEDRLKTCGGSLLCLCPRECELPTQVPASSQRNTVPRNKELDLLHLPGQPAVKKK